MEDNAKLKKAKVYRLLFRILFSLIAFILPLIIISTKYKILKEFSGYKLTAVGIILCIIILWRFKTELMKWINTWEYSVMKYVLIGFSRVYIFILIVVILLMARQGLENLIFCIEWICLCECISYLILFPLEQKYDYQVKRLIRGIERKQDYKEVIEELNGGNN